MNRIKEILKKPWAAYTFALCSAVLLYMILANLPAISRVIASIWKIVSPVFIGIIVAYLLNPLSDFFEFKMLKKMKKRSAAHILAVVLTVACLVLFLAVILVALIPSLIQSGSKLISNWDVYASKAQGFVVKIADYAASRNIKIDMSKITGLIDESVTKMMNLAKENIKPILGTLGNVGSSVSNFFIGVLFGVCFLVAESTLKEVLATCRAAVLKKERLERHNDLWSSFNSVFIRYFACSLLDAVIIAAGALVFMLIMRMPYAALIAVVVGVTNLIPTFGPMIGAAIGIFFLILDHPINALWFLIFMVIWQSIDGMVIKPRLFKGSLGIPAVWTLVLIILGGKIAGILGILLAIPLAAVFVILYKETILPRLNVRISKINEGAPVKAEECCDDNTAAETSEAETEIID